jgi:hypothetical protein
MVFVLASFDPTNALGAVGTVSNIVPKTKTVIAETLLSQDQETILKRQKFELLALLEPVCCVPTARTTWTGPTLFLVPGLETWLHWYNLTAGSATNAFLDREG